MRLNRFVTEVDRDYDQARDRARQSARPASTDEWNLCGVLVHVRPGSLEHVRAALSSKPGVEIHHDCGDGRLIVTIEDSPSQWAGATLTSFYDVDGVINAALVFHQSEIQ